MRSKFMRSNFLFKSLLRTAVAGASASLLMFAAASNADAQQVMLESAVVAPAGAHVQGSTMMGDVTVGQPAVGIARNNQTILEYGFWTNVGVANGVTTRLLPAASMSLNVWPNPATNASTIVLDLAKARNLTITLYDANGRKVSDLWSGNQPAGKYQLKLDATTLASGTYFVTAKTAGEIVQTKVTIVK